MEVRRNFPGGTSAIKCQDWVVDFDLETLLRITRRSEVTRFGADLAKHVIQVRAVAALGPDARIIAEHVFAP